MFAEALRLGRRVGMLATFAPSVAGMEAEFRVEAAAGAPGAKIATELVPEAMAALRAGDAPTHNRLLAERRAARRVRRAAAGAFLDLAGGVGGARSRRLPGTDELGGGRRAAEARRRRRPLAAAVRPGRRGGAMLIGASDLALILAEDGLAGVQTIGVPSEATDTAGADAVVVALKARTAR